MVSEDECGWCRRSDPQDPKPRNPHKNHHEIVRIDLLSAFEALTGRSARHTHKPPHPSPHCPCDDCDRRTAALEDRAEDERIY